jgi:glucose-6-phosphate 1-epimerase
VSARADPAYGGIGTVALADAGGARAEVALHGAHVLSWRADDGRERLFLSARSAYRADAAIRGGVPVIFPQFSDHGPLPRHGFARTAPWTLAEAEGGRAVLRLADAPATRAVWPHAFVAELTVVVAGATLEVALSVRNAGDAPLRFTGALHTYLRVDDVARARLRGLRGTRYRDQTAGGAERIEASDAFAIAGEVDRVYLDAPTVVLEEGGVAPVAVRMDGFRDVVVWNPGAERGAALADLDPAGVSRFVCVEAAAVAAPIEVAPGARWTGRQTLSAG